MTTEIGKKALTRKDFDSGQDVRWCPGCGDYAILAQLQSLLPELEHKREDYFVVSGIGCSSRFPYYMGTYGFHTIHGRAPALATGVRVANPKLVTWLITGDGDGLSIGGNHMLHVLRRNVDLSILLFNNRIYGLTKGQYSPTSSVGSITKSSPFGSLDKPLNPSSFALGAEASFVARTTDRDMKHMKETMRAAEAHKGASFVEILQNCIIFNDGEWSTYTDKESRERNVLHLEDGKPMLFGKDQAYGIRLNNCYATEVVEVDKVGVDQVLVHDKSNSVAAWELALMPFKANMPMPVGIMYEENRPVYEEEVARQEQRILDERGPGTLHELFHSGETWEIG